MDDQLWSTPEMRQARASGDVGAIVRLTRQARRLTLAQLGALCGYSASQVSRYERGVAPLTDVVVLRRFADALQIPPHLLGLAPAPGPAGGAAGTAAAGGVTVARGGGREGGDDPVRRRQLLANLAVTAAAAVGPCLPAPVTVQPVDTGELLVGRLRDTMLGLHPQPPAPLPVDRLRALLTTALSDFHACRYGRLADVLPRLLAHAHATTADDRDDREAAAVLAQTYILATRMLIKLDDPQLGWMAADRARLLASAADQPLTAAEAARNLAILARRAGWYDQAASLVLSAADTIGLRADDPAHTAERGLLLMSAAYTLAKQGDRSGMRELTDDAAAIAGRLGAARGGTLLRDHGGGFSAAAVALHRISAEYSAGDPGAAIAAGRSIHPGSLPTVERRARYHTDMARAFAQWGRREECLRALLAAERAAPEETHARPAVRDLVSGLLLSGRTSPPLRGLAARCGIT
ncbi:helix-turn-helix domain-containing protein [Thermomonospora cellulosilytica]|uniref:HTH cro/C1-type domain-containing protein n=1 Tax=Thermomonospora cellulosilytica TaxID=1411118 RepID=A0A7W3N1R7_9ACTN|nr:helix-turn-helix transcriptional regulator [Thermomonospora cellulosilytica]MBA9005936.1 hypothetical protein [Thermomonospora cellulosilytica]